jgi:hypothetical protein
MPEYFQNGLTVEKMRNLIMQTDMCRKDKNCGACRRVNFCAIWNNRWPDIASARTNGMDLEAYSEHRVKDLPVLVFMRLDDAILKTFDALITYMQVKGLYFNQDDTGFQERITFDRKTEAGCKTDSPETLPG